MDHVRHFVPQTACRLAAGVVLACSTAHAHAAASESRSAAAEPSFTNAPIKISRPLDHTIFPRDFAAPAFRWQDACGADAWEVTVGQGVQSCRSGLLDAPQWTPAGPQWSRIKELSLGKETLVQVTGLRRAQPAKALSRGSIVILTSPDETGAPIFYRDVNLPFEDAVKDPSRILWRLGRVSDSKPPPVVMEKLPVCGNCHSFSADGAVLGMDVDYANDKGAYAIAPVKEEIVLDADKIITWSDYRREDKQRTYGLLSQVSPDGRFVVSTVKDRSVFMAMPDLAYSQLFFPVRGILAVYDRQTKRFNALPGADNPQYVQSNPVWSPDGRELVFARSAAFSSSETNSESLLSVEERREFSDNERLFVFDLYRIPFNGGAGGTAKPVVGASLNGFSNFFAKYSPDGKWIVFCRAKSYMLLQPDSALWIIPAAGGNARRLECNTDSMNSWHSWSPNSRWLVFSSKAAGPYTQLYLTHIDESGRASPPLCLEKFTAPDRAANIPEFAPLAPGALQAIHPRFLNDASFFRSAYAFFRAGDIAGASEKYQQALKLNPHNADAHYNLGLIFMQQKKYTLADEHFKKVMELNPKDVNVRLAAAESLYAQENYGAACKLQREAVELAPETAAPRLALAQTWFRRGDYAQAMRHLDAAARLQQAQLQADGLAEIVRAASEALQQAEANHMELAPEIQKKLELYRAGKSGLPEKTTP